MYVIGTGAGTLFLRALTFKEGEQAAGGGVAAGCQVGVA